MPNLFSHNDVSVTKFMDAVVDDFITKNDIGVTKFLRQQPDDTAVSNWNLEQ